MDWVPHALKRDIDLGFEGAGHPLMIDADPDRLRELVNNLIDNAIRYSQQGGRVTVRTGQTADGQCKLAISDDGAGFDVAAAQERARQGKSLGLPGMEERVSLLGGRFEIDSAPGRGCQVRASFPLPHSTTQESPGRTA